MSPIVGNFVHDLVEMAKAMETLPLVQAELERVNENNKTLADDLVRRESTILRQKAEIEALQAKVREAEVSRDDAELRFLEADDHIAAFRRLVSAFSTDTVALLKAIEPEKPVEAEAPKAESVPEPMPTEYFGWEKPAPDTPPIAAEGWSAPANESKPNPTPPSALSTSQGSVGGEGKPGQSAVDPTVSTDTQSEPVPSGSADGQGGASSTSLSSPNEGPSVQPQDNVGYHNEPAAKWSTDWYEWSNRMDARYGVGWWPERSVA